MSSTKAILGYSGGGGGTIVARLRRGEGRGERREGREERGEEKDERMK